MNIRSFRKEKRISQSELGEKVGYTQQAVAKWESGESEPNTNTLLKLAEIFGCSVDELIRS